MTDLVPSDEQYHLDSEDLVDDWMEDGASAHTTSPTAGGKQVDTLFSNCHHCSMFTKVGSALFFCDQCKKPCSGVSDLAVERHEASIVSESAQSITDIIWQAKEREISVSEAETAIHSYYRQRLLAEAETFNLDPDYSSPEAMKLSQLGVSAVPVEAINKIFGGTDDK